MEAYIWAWSYYGYDTLRQNKPFPLLYLPEKTNPLLHLFAEPHNLYGMSQSKTKIVLIQDNV